MSDKFDIHRVYSYWLEESQESLQVADHLFEKEDYSYALFFGHLAIEKLLKAIYVQKKGEHAPLIHNLLRLARLAGIEIESSMAEDLALITSFNIESRYPDLKRSFRKKCTKGYSTHQMGTIKDIVKWLKSQTK